MDTNVTTLGTLAGWEFGKTPNGDIFHRTPGASWRFYAAAGVFPMTVAGQFFADNDEPFKALDGLVNAIAPAHLRK